MPSGRGSLMLDTGESITVHYSLEIVIGGGVVIVGEIHDLRPAEHGWLGMHATLKLRDSRKLHIIFNEPPCFRATGGYF